MIQFNIEDFGAVGNGVTLNTIAIQKAIDQCSNSGGGLVYFPKGVFLSGSLTLKSNVTVELSAAAVLLASPNIDDYTGVRRQEKFIGSSYFISADGVENVVIRGQGIIDGNGESFWRDEVLNTIPFIGPIMRPKDFRPRSLIYITNSANLCFTDITLKNSPCYTLWTLGCDRVNIDRITIDNPFHGPNTDGLDIDCSSNVHISNCHITAGDDCIALKSDSKRLGKKKACENITVTNCTFSSSACAVRIGYEGDAPIRNCCFSNITINRTDIAFSIVSILPDIPEHDPELNHDEYLEISEGSGIERIVVDNIVMEDVNSAFYIWLGKETDGDYRGYIKDINISNVIATCNNASYICGMTDNKARRINIHSVDLKIKEPVRNLQSEFPYKCGVWGAWGVPYAFYLQNAEQISLDRIRIRAVEGWNKSVLTDSCKNISIDISDL